MQTRTVTDQVKQADANQRLWPGVWAIAGVYLLVHMLTATRYGIFRDAMYLLDCSKHMAWGYVDQPPFFPFIAWIARHTFGESLPALILWPALAGTARIILTTALAREMGAGRFGMAFTAVLSATVAGWFIIDHQFSMNAFEPLFWTGCAFLVVRMIKTGNRRLWLAFGLVAGLGMENKYSMAGFAGSLILGLLLTRQRKLLFTPWLAVGGAVALLVFLPNLIWEIQNQWPFFQFLHNVSASGKDVVLSPGAFLAQQILIVGPALFPFWFSGLVYLLVSRKLEAFRALAWTFLLTIAVFLLSHGKNYYSLPVYPIVLAAGGIALEAWFAGRWYLARPRARIAIQSLLFVWILGLLAVFLPIFLPVLPIDEFLRYQARLPFQIPRSEVGHLGAALPQYYADEFGWPEMVEAVARVYNSLPPEEQAHTAIGTSNYGEAAAVDYFGPRYGLPAAISTHNNFWIWGTHGFSGSTMILVGNSLRRAHELFQEVQVGATLTNPYALPYETRPILLCRKPKRSLAEIWPGAKNWD